MEETSWKDKAAAFWAKVKPYVLYSFAAYGAASLLADLFF